MEVLTSHNKTAVYIDQFRFQEGIFNNAFNGLTHEDALRRPSSHSNHMNWLLGHILHCRYMLANMIGAQAKNPFGSQYWDPITDGEYPGIEEIGAAFPKISNKLITGLSVFTDAEVDAKPTTDRPPLSEIISFFVYHEAYHIGQIGYVRKYIGLQPLQSN